MNTLKPFKRFCITLGEIPSSYLESMSYYETLVWLCNYLNKTIEPSLKETQEAVTELQEFVSHYFDNLDIQEEINNKLDEMAESGELTDIIAQYLGLAGVLAYNTVSDMQSATNLTNGSIAKTLGKSTYLDGEGAFYKIRTITSSDVVDGVNIIALNVSDTLIAEKIPDANISLLFNKINNLENKNYRKMILIGDSYCEQNTDEDITKFYWQYLRDNLSLVQNVNFFASYQSGAGFGNQAFLTKLQDLNNTITDKNSITDILVCGGWNDSDTSQPYGTDEAFNTGILAFNTYVKANYPNAKITIAHISWGDPHITNTDTIFQQMPVSISRYREACNKYGWSYLTGSENILHYYNESFWQTDGNHPSQDGQTLLGNELTRAFVSGSIDIFRLHSGTLAGSGTSEFINYGTLYSILNNDNCEIFTPKSNVGIYVKASLDAQTINCDGAHDYEIGTIYTLEAVGYSPFVMTNVPCYFTGTFNDVSSTYLGFADVFINNSKLYIRPTLFINGSRAESFVYNYIWLPNFKISASSRYC